VGVGGGLFHLNANHPILYLSPVKYDLFSGSHHGISSILPLPTISSTNTTFFLGLLMIFPPSSLSLPSPRQIRHFFWVSSCYSSKFPLLDKYDLFLGLLMLFPPCSLSLPSPRQIRPFYCVSSDISSMLPLLDKYDLFCWVSSWYFLHAPSPYPLNDKYDPYSGSPHDISSMLPLLTLSSTNTTLILGLLMIFPSCSLSLPSQRQIRPFFWVS
jgi:hypothetical protein